MKAYAIFEGGGAKGLAHVGALAAAEGRQIEFCGVAGASAGAIVAALVAAGYKSTDMFDPSAPDDKTKIYGTALDKLLDSPNPWSAYEKAFQEISKAFSGDNLNTIKAFYFYYFKYAWLRKELESERGFFSTKKIELLLDELLERKLCEQNAELKNYPELSADRKEDEVRICFKHLSLPLKIVATDVTNHKLVVFSKKETPNYSVAKAVGASISLPLVFKPHVLEFPESSSKKNTIQAVDGGLLSNFPAWIFDEERSSDGPHIPTFGFRLVQKSTELRKSSEGMFGFAKNLLSTVIDGDPLLETREIENLHEILLTVTTKTLQFDLLPDSKKELFNEGLNAAFEHFARPGFPREPKIAKLMLENIIEHLRTNLDIPSETVLRANIVCMTTRNTLRVTYSYNMDSDDDADDRLEFPIGSGACGYCWTSKQPVTCDLVQAKTQFTAHWRMDKYQQALVRNDLKSLVCYPIRHAGKVLGILNIDSPDENLRRQFESSRTMSLLNEAERSLISLLAPSQQEQSEASQTESSISDWENVEGQPGIYQGKESQQLLRAQPEQAENQQAIEALRASLLTIMSDMST